MIEIQFSPVHVRLASNYHGGQRSRLYSVASTGGHLIFADERFAMMFLINLDGELESEIHRCTNRNNKRSFVAMKKFLDKQINRMGYARLIEKSA